MIFACKCLLEFQNLCCSTLQRVAQPLWAGLDLFSALIIMNGINWSLWGRAGALKRRERARGRRCWKSQGERRKQKWVQGEVQRGGVNHKVIRDLCVCVRARTSHLSSGGITMRACLCRRWKGNKLEWGECEWSSPRLHRSLGKIFISLLFEPRWKSCPWTL